MNTLGNFTNIDSDQVIADGAEINRTFNGDPAEKITIVVEVDAVTKVGDVLAVHGPPAFIEALDPGATAGLVAGVLLDAAKLVGALAEEDGE